MPVVPRSYASRLCWAVALTLVGALASPAGATAPPRRDIQGLGLGMTAERLVAVPGLHCAVNKTKDVSCEDPKDGSQYKVLMSGAEPSLALSVKHTFCSPGREPAVLAALLKAYGLSARAARPNPNGASFDISPSVTGNLNATGGGCAKGGTTYQFTISDSGLMMMQGATGAAGAQTQGLASRPPAMP